MTICPFMSRPAVSEIVTCIREECAAWGPVARTLAGAAVNGCRLIGGGVPE